MVDNDRVRRFESRQAAPSRGAELADARAGMPRIGPQLTRLPDRTRSEPGSTSTRGKGVERSHRSSGKGPAVSRRLNGKQAVGPRRPPTSDDAVIDLLNDMGHPETFERYEIDRADRVSPGWPHAHTRTVLRSCTARLKTFHA